jgi:hypothetical protein
MAIYVIADYSGVLNNPDFGNIKGRISGSIDNAFQK